MRVGHNLLAGWVNSAWSALLAFAVVPFYLRYLGVESYGLIGFYVTLQALIQLLDLGMAATMNREVARGSSAGDYRAPGELLQTLAALYWAVAGVIALVVWSLSSWIGQSWLKPQQLSQETISHVVALMGLVVACRWPIGLYQGVLVGAQRLVLASGISMAMSTLSNLGAVLILAFVSRSIEAFFLWQAAVGILYAVCIRFAAWQTLGPRPFAEFNIKRLLPVWKFSAGMSGIALTSAVFTQLDKVILSKNVALSEFGHYMVAVMVMSGLHILIAPVFNVVFPRMSALVAAKDDARLLDLYRSGSRMFASAIFPAAMLIAVFGKEFVTLWTGNADLAIQAAPIIAFLAVGSALNGIMFFPYALQLAHGMTWLPLAINIGLICLMAPLVIVSSRMYGAVGAAFSWMAIEVIYVIVGRWLTHKHLLKGSKPGWLAADVGVPLAWALAGGGLLFVMSTQLAFPLFANALLGLLVGLGVLLLSARPFFTDKQKWKSLLGDEVGATPLVDRTLKEQGHG